MATEREDRHDTLLSADKLLQLQQLVVALWRCGFDDDDDDDDLTTSSY
jgi:hypothetical protein